MDSNRKELSSIKEVLKESPRGMTVTEISKAVKMNRHSVAKYLEVLVASGHVDMKTFGPSKVYFLSPRVPLSAMLGFSSDMIVILDKDMRIRNINEKFLEFIKTGRDDILNKNIENFPIYSKVEPRLTPYIKSALDGQEASVETCYKNGSAGSFYFIIKVVPTVFEDGEKCATLIMSDITGRMRIENAIRESERKFRNMLEQSTDGISMSDERGVIIEYNRSLENLSGLSSKDVLGKYVWEIPFYQHGYEQIPDRSPILLKDYMRIFLKTGQSPLTERFTVYDLIRPDGTFLTVQANIFPIKTDKGYMTCAIVRDITDMKKAEMAIKESEEKFRSIIEQSLDGILLIDDKGIIVEFNKGLEQITGFRKKDAVGKTAWDAYTRILPSKEPMPINSLDALKKRIMTDERLTTKADKKFFDIEMTRPDGKRCILQALVFTIKTDKGDLICVIIRDITEQKHAEEALRRERAELETRVKERTMELEKANRSLKAEILQRIRSEDALRESEEKFRSLIESINDVAWEKDRSGRFTYISPRIRDIMGFEPGIFLGKVIIDFMQPEERAKISQEYWGLFERPSAYSFQELRVRHKDGHEVILESNGSPCYDKNGVFLGYRGLARDITKRKSIERELRLTRFSVERSSEEIFWIESNGRVFYVNDSTCHAMGYTREKLENMYVWEFDPTFSAEKWSTYFSDLRKNGSQNFETLHKTCDGRVFPVDIMANYVEYEGKEYSFAFVRDITERKRADEAIREKEEKYRNIVENINDVVWEMDKESRFTYVSPRITEILGFEPDHYIGKVIVEFMPEEDRKEFLESFSRVFKNPKPYGLEHFRMYHKDGGIRSMEVNGTPFYDEKGELAGFRGVTRDITKRRRMEEMLDLMKYSIDHSEDAAFWIKPDSTFYYVNEAACNMLGYTRDELLGMSVEDIDIYFKPESWREHWELIKRDKHHKMESVNRTKEGSTFIVDIVENYLEYKGEAYDFAFVRPVSPPRHKTPSNNP